MSLFAIRPEFAGAFDATRFVAEDDEPTVEAVYRVGNSYFPASVFHALFAPPYDEGQDAVARPSPPLDSPVRDSPKVTQADITATVKEVLAKHGSLPSAAITDWVALALGIDTRLISESLAKGVKAAIAKLLDAGAVERSVAAPGQAGALMRFELVGAKQ